MIARLVCMLFDHAPASTFRARWTFCTRCHRNYWTGGNRGR